jgi:hypothetical protein
MEMTPKRRGFLRGFLLAAASLLPTLPLLAQDDGPSRSAYTYIRDMSGEVIVESRWNGRVEARRNLPITAGDVILVEDGGRAEVALADGNLLHVGPGSRARFLSLSGQEGEDAEVSAIDLEEGSLILSVFGADERGIPRIDTQEATVYAGRGARVRVNADQRRGTVVIAREGSADVRTPEDSYRLRAGSYLIAEPEEEPEIARGSFSRDRFDLWAADRIELTYESPRSASGRYVDEEYESDVVALDGYGDWDYSDTYSTHVWRPRVSVGWTPYSHGSWYYTPLGQTWWSHDPWGWYPFHYGSWFFDAGWSRWCWAPSYVYSPAWVYWAYTPSYVGWCPIGYYSFYSPWFNNYYRHWGIPRRAGIYFSVHGSFSARNIDFRGWNFVNSGGFGAAVSRMDVIPGSRLAGRITGQVAVSSRPLVVSARPGAARDAVRDYVREAPRVIERSASSDSARMAPVLARQDTLPQATVSALRERVAVAERGRLSGPGAAGVAPRTVAVQRGRGGEPGWQPRAADDSGPSERVIVRGRSTQERPEAPSERAAPRGEESGSWRERGRRPVVSRDGESGPSDRGSMRSEPRLERSPEAGDWRGRGRPAPADVAPPRGSSGEESWRGREVERRSVPPARRVIEGSVPGRRPPKVESAPRGRVDAPQRFEAPRGRDYQPRVRESAPRDSRPAPAPRIERAPPRSVAPPPPRSQSRPSQGSSSSGNRGRPKS